MLQTKQPQVLEQNEDNGIFDDENVVDFPSSPEEEVGSSRRVSAVVPSPVEKQGAPAKPKLKLVCMADANGFPMVAKASIRDDGSLNMQEEYRQPTKTEFNKLQRSGQIISRGSSPQRREEVVQAQPEVIEQSYSPFEDEQQQSVVDIANQQAIPAEIVEPTGKVSNTVKVAAVGIGATVLAGLGFWYFRKRKSLNDAYNELMDDDEDDDD